MFDSEVYIERRRGLLERVGSGLILLLGNDESPANYPDNPYPFRQDSSFLYYIGIDRPGLAAVLDCDSGGECVFGDDLGVDDIIWTGPQPSLQAEAEHCGIADTACLSDLQGVLAGACEDGREIHFLPQYRAENVLKIERLLGIVQSAVADAVSEPLIRAVVAQRSYKSDAEIAEIEASLDVSYEMNIAAMKACRAGKYEREIAGMMEGIALSRGFRLSFPTIFSVRGEVLHNHYHGNLMKDGDIAVNDSGVESPLGYASDITRTIPVGGKFTQRQRDVYAIVLDAQQRTIEAVKPGVEFRNVHLLAARVLLDGLKGLGLVSGDTEEAARAGAHTLFFQCGLGHMMGLDVHDMEGLGEDYVGYTDTIRRNPEFGFKSLRLGKALEPGFVITVEPGLYFIPELFGRWRAENKLDQYIKYGAVEKFMDFGGVRIEDDVLVTDEGNRWLGKPIPRTIEDVEQSCSA